MVKIFGLKRVQHKILVLIRKTEYYRRLLRTWFFCWCRCFKRSHSILKSPHFIFFTQILWSFSSKILVLFFCCTITCIQHSQQNNKNEMLEVLDWCKDDKLKDSLVRSDRHSFPWRMYTELNKSRILIFFEESFKNKLFSKFY